MSRANLTPQPGWAPGATPADSRGGWWRMSLVRWTGRVMQPIGGWASIPGYKLNDAVRQLQSWRDLSGLRLAAAASLDQVMVYDGSTFTDILPSDFTPGTVEPVRGYGMGPYGRGTYGTPRDPSGGVTVGQSAIDTLALDNWGQNLVMCGSADRRILWWVPGTPAAVPIPPAALTPTEDPAIVHVVPSAILAFVTDERFVVALGMNGDIRRVGWSDQERPGAWTPDITNLAGSLQLNTTGTPRMGKRTPFGGSLIWCDDDVHLLTFLGPPDAYGLRRIGTGCSSISPTSMAVTAQAVAWMGQESFWRWDGGPPQPLASPLQQLVFDSINRDAQNRVTCGYNGQFPELWWFYPDTSSVEPNRYVVWNFQSNRWYGGALARTALTEPAAFGRPLMGDATGQVYAHETGWTADGVPRGAAVFAESGDILLQGEGDRAAYIAQLIPDFGGSVEPSIRLFGRWEPEDIEEDWGLFPLTRADGLIDVDQEARRIRFRIEGADLAGTAGPPWTLGTLGAEVQPGAGR